MEYDPGSLRTRGPGSDMRTPITIDNEGGNLQAGDIIFPVAHAGYKDNIKLGVGTELFNLSGRRIGEIGGKSGKGSGTETIKLKGCYAVLTDRSLANMRDVKLEVGQGLYFNGPRQVTIESNVSQVEQVVEKTRVHEEPRTKQEPSQQEKRIAREKQLTEQKIGRLRNGVNRVKAKYREQVGISDTDKIFDFKFNEDGSVNVVFTEESKINEQEMRIAPGTSLELQTKTRSGRWATARSNGPLWQKYGGHLLFELKDYSRIRLLDNAYRGIESHKDVPAADHVKAKNDAIENSMEYYRKRAEWKKRHPGQ